jgi:ribonuclease HII
MIGVDEVGRGSWAGPLLVVAARAKTGLPSGIKDSKAMTRTQRLKILNELSICCEFGEGWVSALEIDKIGLSYAIRRGVQYALDSLRAGTDEVIIMDGNVNYCPRRFRQAVCQISADRDVSVVSAASIYAKVTRDAYMRNLNSLYPGYGFDKHVGYGTEFHKLMLKKLGIIPGVHRNSFKPIKQAEGL